MQSNRKKFVKRVKEISTDTAKKMIAAHNAINDFFTEGLSYDGFNGPEEIQKAIANRQKLSMV